MVFSPANSKKLPKVLRCKLARLDQDFLGTRNFFFPPDASNASDASDGALAGKLKEAAQGSPLQTSKARPGFPWNLQFLLPSLRLQCLRRLRRLRRLRCLNASDAYNASDASDASGASSCCQDSRRPFIQASCSIQSSALTSQQPPVLGGSSVETSFLMSPLRSTINNPHQGPFYVLLLFTLLLISRTYRQI